MTVREKEIIHVSIRLKKEKKATHHAQICILLKVPEYQVLLLSFIYIWVRSFIFTKGTAIS